MRTDTEKIHDESGHALVKRNQDGSVEKLKGAEK